MSLIPVTSKEIPIGVALPWPLYAEDYSLLLSAGEVVTDEAQQEKLLARGVFRELTWEISSTDQPVHSREETTSEVANFTFDDMRLKVDSRLQLEPPSQLSHERYIVKVIGFLKGVCLLVTAPVGERGLRLLLKEHDTVILRFFSGMNVFAFSCKVEHFFNLPYNYYHLTFPESIQGVKIRKTPRIRTHIVAGVLYGEAEQHQQKSAIISDISASGVSLVSEHELGDKDSQLRLVFSVQLNHADMHLSVQAFIRTVTPDEEDRLIHYGVEFGELPASDAVVLQSMIYQQMHENPHRVK